MINRIQNFTPQKATPQNVTFGRNFFGDNKGDKGDYYSRAEVDTLIRKTKNEIKRSIMTASIGTGGDDISRDSFRQFASRISRTITKMSTHDEDYRL